MQHPHLQYMVFESGFKSIKTNFIQTSKIKGSNVLLVLISN